MRKIVRMLAVAIICTFMLTGCSETIELNLEPIVKEKNRLEKQELENPVSTVHVMIDKRGYELKDNKKVFFVGAKQKEKFQVIDATSKEIVYEDETYPNAEVYVGDFTSVDVEGEYYIKTKKIGQSYPIYISDSIWNNIFAEELEKTESELAAVDEEKLLDTAMGVQVLLFAIQSFPESFEQDKTLITSLLKTANTIMEMQNEDGSFANDYSTTAACGGVMLMCAEQFGKYDSQMAAEFINTSDLAKGWMDNNDNAKVEAAKFYYMCQRFHTDKDGVVYKEEIEKYILQNIANIADNDYSFWGSALYISAEKNTDRDICTKIMQSIVGKIEKITESVKKQAFLVDRHSLENVMHEVELVCFIDYITPSREYMEIIKNTMHYLLGANISNDTIPHESLNWNSLWSCINIMCLADINH